MTGPTVDRQRIIDTLAAAFEPRPEALAAFLGGSDASGRTDRYSDVDFQVLAEDAWVEEAFSVAHRALESLSPILHRHRLPEPTWHGHAQEFLVLRDADPAHFVDLVVLRRSREDRFLEPERHGTAVVLFDKLGLIAPAPFDRDAHRVRMEARLRTLRETFPIFQTLVTRAVRRGFPAEAAVAYQAYTLRPLVEILRIRHCPDRFDFGARYLDRDLPAELRAEVEALALPGDPEAVEEFRRRAEALFLRTAAEIP